MASLHPHRPARLSELARRVLVAAEQHAAALGHPVVGVGHLLLALMQEQRGIAALLLHEAGLVMAEVRAGLAAGHAGLLADGEVIVELALALAEAAGSHYVGTEHVLLALTQDHDAADVLSAHGAHLLLLQDAVRAHLPSGH